MSIGAARRRFEAFAAGQLPESELRASVRAELEREPQLASAYVALVSALGRGRVISAGLEARILADIGTVTGTRPQAPIDVISALDARPIVIDEPIYADPIEPRAATDTDSVTGSAWDTPEGLTGPAAPLPIGTLLKQRFELLEELGRGGVGVVYKALDRNVADLKERSAFVAIKVLNERFRRHRPAVRSLQREARRAQELRHPNIVTVLDFERDGGSLYMVMELLTGRSLDQLLRSDAAYGLPLPRVREIVGGMGAALSKAHEQGIVHADFKPGNAFITDAGQVKVLDFGVAGAGRSLNVGREKVVSDAGQSGELSSPYASPEILSGEAPDSRDDVYALACVTYELLTGRHPFNRIDALQARDTGMRPAAPKQLSGSQWRGLRQGLAFQRAERSASVQAFVDAVFGTRRRRWWWPVAAAVILAAVAIGSWLPRQWEAAGQAARLSQELLTTDPAQFASALADLRAASAPLRTDALADGAALKLVLDHYDAAIAAASAAPTYDFARARAELSELRSLLPDSTLVADRAAALDQAVGAALTRELAKRDAALANGILIPSQGADDLASVLGRIRRIDASQAALTDPRIAAAYLAAAKKAGDAGQPELADELLQAGLQVAPNDHSLLRAKSTADAELQRQANARRVAELEQRLGAIGPAAPDLLDQVLAKRDDFSALASLAPADPLLLGLQSNLQSAALERVRRMLALGDIAGARQLLLDVGELLPEPVAASANAEVSKAAQALDDQGLDTLQRLRGAVLGGRLTQAGDSGATQLYASLQRSGASPGIVAQARDLLAYGYLRQARSALAAGDRAGAQDSLRAARALQPSALWQQRLKAEQDLLDGRGAGESTNAAPSGHELDSVRQRLAETLRSPSLGAKELPAVADELDRLEALGSSAQELDSARRQVEDRVLAEITRVQQQSGVDQAESYAQQASESLLASERIAQAARQLRDSARGATRVVAPDVPAMRDQASPPPPNPGAAPAPAALTAP